MTLTKKQKDFIELMKKRPRKTMPKNACRCG